MDTVFTLKLVSGMTKARLGDTMATFPRQSTATALKGDRFFFSALTSANTPHSGILACIDIKSDLSPYITTYVVEHVPVRLPHYPDKADLDYIGHEAGLYPDLLRPADCIHIMHNLHQIYFEVNIPNDLTPGTYPIVVALRVQGENATVAQEAFTLEVLDATLPALDIHCTQWFHYDCLADYYNVEVFSERHWEIIENFMSADVKGGMNTILTPIFTPPLDTAIGGERPTVQLVDITRENGSYFFGFEKLERFCSLCKKVGISDLEIAHFFTQWGAAHAPKIMATDDGVYRRIFGWESDATGEDYITFLREFIPAVKAKLDEFGYKDHYFFHISDEPNENQLESYAAAKNAIWDLICDYPVRDALSKYDFYEKGVVQTPIVSNNHIDEFIEKKVPDLWVYYCCSQGEHASNRFYAMPGYRTRVLGAQMYKANTKGFLQWGYNFYYCRHSQYLINPFLINDGDYAWPAGDAFAVYPGTDGKPILSLHEIHFEQSLLDLRAMKAAEQRVGREAVLSAVGAEGRIDFNHYPRNESYLLTLRDTVNRMAASK